MSDYQTISYQLIIYILPSFSSAVSFVFQQGTPQKPQENGGDGEDESDLKQCVCNLIVVQKDGPSDNKTNTVMLRSNAQVVPECMVSPLGFC